MSSFIADIEGITLGRALSDTDLAGFSGGQGAAECTVNITVLKNGKIVVTTEGNCPEVQVE